MPSPFVIPLINAGANIAQNGINAALTGMTNRKQRKYNEESYARQRRDALADRDYDNEYNSPRAQMQRLRDANLNPNLVYGHGADAQGVSPRGVSMDTWKPEAPQVDIKGTGQSLMDIYDIKIKEAQIDNLHAQNEVIKQEALLKATDVSKANIDLGQHDYQGLGDMPFYQAIKESQFSMSQAQLRNTDAQTSVLLSRNEREALTNSQSLREGIERIATMRQGRALTTEQMNSIRNDTKLKELEIKYRRDWNISGNDNIFIRIAAMMLSKMGIKP